MSHSRLANVEPYSVTKDSFILTLIRTQPFAHLSNKSINIPTPNDVDVESIIQHNNEKLIQGHRIINEDNTTNQDNVTEIKEDRLPVKFIDIRGIVPKNLKEQLNTIIIKNFPNLKKIYIETILDTIFPMSNYKWSRLNQDNVVIIYVQVESLVDLKYFKRHHNAILEKLEVNITIDTGVETYLQEITQDLDADIPKMQSVINNVIINQKAYEVEDIAGTEGLDEILNHYTNYKIDNAELIDVPKDMKESIISDIVKFRSRVLLMEKNKREQELAQERLKSKAVLQKIVNEIQESKDNNQDEPQNEENILQEPPEESPELNDKQYEDLVHKKTSQDLDSKYQLAYNNIQLKQSEKNKLLSELENLKNYEHNLLDNKFKHIEYLRDFHEYSSNHKSSKLNLYYTNYNQYLTVRNKDRQREEHFDNLDREEEKTHERKHKRQDPTDHEEESPSTSKRQKAQPSNNGNGSTEKNGTSNIETTKINVSRLSNDKQKMIKDKIESLVEEYLGIKEEVLIDFIYEYLMNNDLTNLSPLINDLSETLDDDSEIVVNELVNYIKITI